MKLKTLKLQNFRGFVDLSLSFEPDLTVLVGANGAGKSSILDAIVIALSGPLSNDSGFLLNIQPEDVRSSQNSADIIINLFNEKTNQDISELSVNIKNEDRVWTPQRNMHNARIWPLVLLYSTSRSTLDQTPGSTKGRTWVIKNAWNSWYEAADSYKDFFIWFREMEDLENEQVRFGDGHENPQLSIVRKVIMTLMPGLSEIRVRRQMSPYRYSPVLSFRKGESVLPFDALSEGERSTIAMFADIARRMSLLYGDRENPLEGELILLIDEIEQHIHPAWQRMLMEKFHHIFPNAQLITTTHSPIIVSEIEPRQLRVLKDFRLIETEHGIGKDANAVLEDTFGTTVRSRKIQEKLDNLEHLIDDDRLGEAEEALRELEGLMGDDPDLVFYRNILRRLSAK